MQVYNSTDMVTAWKNFHYILSKWLDFHIIDCLSMTVDVFFYVYVHFAFDWWDIATEVCEMVY